jgi:UDP-N-acetyl-D-galactosamine dehydrogenase
VVDVVRELEDYDAQVEIYDPWVSSAEALREYGISPISSPDTGAYDAIVLAVAHDAFREQGVAGIRAWGRAGHLLYDLKHVFKDTEADLRL